MFSLYQRSNDKVVVSLFDARISPCFSQKLASEYPGVVFAKVNIEKAKVCRY